MKVLLDENLPRKLKFRLAPHEVFTVREMGWNGQKNGRLLKSMEEAGFQTLITADKNLSFQQNLSRTSVAVLVLNVLDTSYEEMVLFVPRLREMLAGELKTGVFVIDRP